MVTVAHADEHTLSYETRAARARTGVLLFILSDATFVAAIIASQAYLRILDVLRQFHPHAEAVPSLIFGLIITLLTVASAGVFYWAVRRLNNGDAAAFRTGVLGAWALVLVALVCQIILLVTLRYPTPLHAYASLVVLLSGYHAIHLFVTALLGFLLVGRITHNRIVGYEYVVTGAGYWWYYVAVAAAAMWAVLTFVT